MPSHSHFSASYGHAEQARLTCDARPGSGGIPKYPQPSPRAIAWEKALKDALLSQTVRMRQAHKLKMLKPMPMRYVPDISHVKNCTLCANQAAAHAAARRHALCTALHERWFELRSEVSLREMRR